MTSDWCGGRVLSHLVPGEHEQTSGQVDFSESGRGFSLFSQSPLFDLARGGGPSFFPLSTYGVRPLQFLPRGALPNYCHGVA